MPPLAIAEGGLEAADVIALLRLHLAGMHAASPPESVHALDLSALRAPDMSFWTARRDGVLQGMAALREIGAGHGEIKSMRTVAAALRSGVAAALLGHILVIAAARGYVRLSLETGSGAAFQPAHALYRRHGFLECGPFGDYRDGDPFSRFMSRAI